MKLCSVYLNDYKTVEAITKSCQVSMLPPHMPLQWEIQRLQHIKLNNYWLHWVGGFNASTYLPSRSFLLSSHWKVHKNLLSLENMKEVKVAHTELKENILEIFSSIMGKNRSVLYFLLVLWRAHSWLLGLKKHSLSIFT